MQKRPGLLGRFLFGAILSPSLPATNAKRLRKGAKATKQSIAPQAEAWIASLRSQ